MGLEESLLEADVCVGYSRARAIHSTPKNRLGTPGEKAEDFKEKS